MGGQIEKVLHAPKVKLRLLGDNSVANLISQGQLLLQSVSDSAKLDTEILLCFVLDKTPSYLLTWPEKILSDQELNDFLVLLARRSQGEPIAYITGIKEFWSLPLAVSKATLIPRPDTETLVELVLDHYQQCENIRCLDLGTGTGAIALALASEKPNWDIDAVDFNADAVKLAQANAHTLRLNQVNIFQSDWFSQLEANKPYHVIVSNPPYIDEKDDNLSHGDVRFEPDSALIAKDNGLADIKHIAARAQHFLHHQGMLCFEHGFDQGAQVRQILQDLDYKQAQTAQDLNGHDRVTWAIFAKSNNNNK